MLNNSRFDDRLHIDYLPSASASSHTANDLSNGWAERRRIRRKEIK